MECRTIDRYEKKISKSGGEACLESYKNGLKMFDQYLYELVDTYWKYHDVFEVKTYDEVMALQKAKSTEYVVLALGNNEGMYPYWPEEAAASGADLHEISDSYLYARLELFLIEDADYSSKHMEVSLPHRVPYKSDIKFGIDYLVYALEDMQDAKWFKKVSARTKTLKNKTLILCSDYLEAETNETVIKEVYPYPFIIADRTKYEELAFSGSADNALVYNDKGEMFITDGETGSPLFYDFDVYAQEIRKPKRINKADFKELLENIKLSEEGKTIR